MSFAHPIFLTLFLPVFLLVYLVVPHKWKNAVVLALSILFYAWGAPLFALLLLASGSVDHWVAGKFGGPHGKKWLVAGIAYNVLTLAVFKYFNFFVENFRAVATALGFSFPGYMEIALPIGISFFTFHKISYLVDVFREDVKRAESLGNYLLYVFLFPQLVAGPIVRYKEIGHQINDRASDENWQNRLGGLYRFAIGLARKVLVADTLATFVDPAFAATDLSPAHAALALVAYAMQIYFDFGGYSDMAIGLAQMMGFRFPENFDWPYLAAGFRDFWRKWHITLSVWMRDYLYLPLGGDRRGSARTFANLWAVFLLSNLWHGASWNFVLWGAWHGAFLTLERVTGVFSKMPKSLAVPLAFVLVSLGWVWFRAETLVGALAYFAHIFQWEGGTVDISPKQVAMLCTALGFAFLPKLLRGALMQMFRSKNDTSDLWKTLVAALLMVLCLGQLAIVKDQPFIYFRF